MKRAPNHPLQKTVEYLLTEFTRSGGKQVTTKLPEQWLTIREAARKEDLEMADIYSIDGKKLVTGGKTPPPTGGDWLTPMKVGTVFVCELNQDIGLQAAIQQEYILQRRDGNSVMLMSNLNEPEVHARVNPERFCKYYDLIVVLSEPEQEQENGSY